MRYPKRSKSMSSSSSSSFTSSFFASAASPPAAAAEGLELREPGSHQVRNRTALEAGNHGLEFRAVVVNAPGLQDLLDVLSGRLFLTTEVRHGVRGNVFHSHGGIADLCPAEDVEKILQAGGIDYDSSELKAVIARFEGSSVSDLMTAGLAKLETLGGGGGGGAGPAAGGAAAAAGGDAAEAKKEEVKEEEEEEDMDFDLFG